MDGRRWRRPRAQPRTSRSIAGAAASCATPRKAPPLHASADTSRRRAALGHRCPLASVVDGLTAGQIAGLLTTADPVTGGAPAPTPTRGVALPGTTPPRPTAPTTTARPAAQFTRYRTTIGSLKLNKKRSSMKFRLSCESTAPKGCRVKVSARIAGKSAMRSMTMALLPGRSAPVTVTFSKSTTRRLKTKGGTLKITAQTALSSLPAATRTLKVRRLRP